MGVREVAEDFPPLRFIFAAAAHSQVATTGKQEVEEAGEVEGGRRRVEESGAEEEEDLPGLACSFSCWRVGVGPVRRQAAFCVYNTTGATGSLNSSVETLALLLKPIEDGWRQGRQGLGQGETEGGLQERQGWTPVPRRKVGSILEGWF